MSVYDVFRIWQGWNPATVDVNLKSVDAAEFKMSATPDKKSIMFYAMPQQVFVKGEKSACFIMRENLSLSRLDEKAASLLYPTNPSAAIAAINDAQVTNRLAMEAGKSLSPPQAQVIQAKVDTVVESQKPLLYIQIHSEGDRQLAKSLQDAAREAGFLAPGIENVAKKRLQSSLKYVEVRYLRSIDEASAQKAAQVISASSGSTNVKLIELTKYAVNKNLIEIWLPDGIGRSSP